MNPILVVDDNEQILDILSQYIKKENWPFITAASGEDALKMFKAVDPSLILLDIMLPGIDGLEVCRRIRSVSSVPILMITARDEDADRILGLDIGADDYIVKPFSNVELLMRVRAILRRSGASSSGTERSNQVLIQDLRLDLDSQSVIRGGEGIPLTYTEFKILELLATHRKKIYSLDNIYESIWGENAVGDGAIMVHIKNIRKKLGDNSRNPTYIKTAWGRGYYID